jgi:Na+/H+ antiporter NhaD/arsenite permease-like protein
VPFVVNLAPVIIVVMIAFVFTVKVVFRREFVPMPDAIERVMQIDDSQAITDHDLLCRSGTVLVLTIAAFVVHGWLHLEPATVALAGAALLLLITKVEIHEILEEVEWTTLFFFIGLFVMVTGMVRVGIIKMMADWLLGATQGNVPAMTLLILWFSAFASAIIDNIPFVATMNPLIIGVAAGMAGYHGDLTQIPGDQFVQIVHATKVMPLWWALSLGACLGGNGTIIGASANVVVAGISERHGYPITFRSYLKYGMLFMIESVAICMVYLWLRYLVVLAG